MDNKLEKGENFKVEGSLDSDATSKDKREEDLSGELLKENQKDFIMDTPSGTNTNNTPQNDPEKDAKRSSTENGNGTSIGNP